MKQNWWVKFKQGFYRNFMDFLKIFAAEEEFINKGKGKSSQIKEQDRYGSTPKQR